MEEGRIDDLLGGLHEEVDWRDIFKMDNKYLAEVIYMYIFILQIIVGDACHRRFILM